MTVLGLLRSPTFTATPRTTPALPVISLSTLPNLQKLLRTLSSCTITTSPTLMVLACCCFLASRRCCSGRLSNETPSVDAEVSQTTMGQVMDFSQRGLIHLWDVLNNFPLHLVLNHVVVLIENLRLLSKSSQGASKPAQTQLIVVFAR